MRGNPAPNLKGLIPFKKGQTGNPRGRPKGTKEHSPDFRRARDFTELSVETLAEMMQGFRTVKSGNDGKQATEPVTASIQFTAAVTLLERGWGKAPQALHLTGDVQVTDTSDDTDALDAIRSSLNSIASRVRSRADTELIEHDAAPET